MILYLLLNIHLWGLDACNSITAWCKLSSRVFLWERNWKYIATLFSPSVSSETVVSHSTLSSRSLINVGQNRTKESPSQNFAWYTLSVREYSKLIFYVIFFSSCMSFKTEYSCWTLYMQHVLGMGLFCFQSLHMAWNMTFFSRFYFLMLFSLCSWTKAQFCDCFFW